MRRFAIMTAKIIGGFVAFLLIGGAMTSFLLWL